MTTFPQREIARLAPGETGIAQFALQVVSLMVGDTGHASQPPRTDVLDLLIRGAKTGDPVVLNSLLAEFRRLRIPAEVVIDVYLPAAANAIGAQWHADEIDILDCTIAMSRMQNLLRALGRAWRADDSAGAGKASVLMVVPENEQHILGAMVATTQLRRFGVSVAVRLAPARPALHDLMANRRFDAVFVHCANIESLETCGGLVRTIRRGDGAGLPVVVGGSVPLEADEIKRRTGADLMTRDVRHALQALGLERALQVA